MIVVIVEVVVGFWNRQLCLAIQNEIIGNENVLAFILLWSRDYSYQLVDCLYTLFKYRFDGKIVTKNGQVFDNIERAARFNQRHKTVERMQSIAKKRLLRKKYKRHLLSSLQKTISTQTSGSVFADRIEQVKKTKLEVELIKIVDCFLDGYGKYDSNLVSFKIKSL